MYDFLDIRKFSGVLIDRSLMPTGSLGQILKKLIHCQVYISLEIYYTLEYIYYNLYIIILYIIIYVIKSQMLLLTGYRRGAGWFQVSARDSAYITLLVLGYVPEHHLEEEQEREREREREREKQ